LLYYIAKYKKKLVQTQPHTLDNYFGTCLEGGFVRNPTETAVFAVVLHIFSVFIKEILDNVLKLSSFFATFRAFH
jgi:hypothetical protein